MHNAQPPPKTGPAYEKEGVLSAERIFSGPAFLLLLAAAVFASFPKVMLGINTFFYRDFGFLCYPQAFYERQAFLEGQLPLWNPYNYCGVPFMAQWGAWYPTYFLSAIFPVPWSINFFHLLHLLGAGGGMYWLFRRWGGSPFAAAFAGFAYVFNGVTLSSLMWISYTAFLAWCPWVLGCTMSAWRVGGRWIPLAALTAAMQVLAGAPELTVFFWLLVGLLWLADVLGGTSALETGNSTTPSAQDSLQRNAPVPGRSEPRQSQHVPVSKGLFALGHCCARGRANSGWRSLRRVSLVVLLAGGITMVQMLPFFDLLAHSQRDRNFGGNEWAMPGWGWANLLVPLFHCYFSVHGPWFQTGQLLVSSYYLGAGVLVLASAGAWLTRRRLGAVLGGMALVCWIMAAGQNGFLFGWVKQVFPWIGIARYPVKCAFFPVLLVPLLAGWSIDTVLGNGDKKHHRFLAVLGVAALLVMAGLLWFARAHPMRDDNWNATAENAFWRAVLMVLLLGGILWLGRFRVISPIRTTLQLGLLFLAPLDAFTHNPGLAPAFPSSTMVPGVWTLSGKPPPPKLGEGRVMNSPGARYAPSGAGPVARALLFTRERACEEYSLNLLDGVSKVGGLTILRPAYFQRFSSEMHRSGGTGYSEGLLDFLSVAWTNSAENPVAWSPRTNHLPVISAGQRPVFASDEVVLQAMKAKDFNPRELVYLNSSARDSVAVTNRTTCTVLCSEFSPHKVEADVDAAEPSLVVLSQSVYHLWRAYVDGKPVPLLRANLAFQALQVPVGRHHVSLEYRDPFLRLGAIVSLLSLIACGLIWCLTWRTLPGRLARSSSR